MSIKPTKERQEILDSLKAVTEDFQNEPVARADDVIYQDWALTPTRTSPPSIINCRCLSQEEWEARHRKQAEELFTFTEKLSNKDCSELMHWHQIYLDSQESERKAKVTSAIGTVLLFIVAIAVLIYYMRYMR